MSCSPALLFSPLTAAACIGGIGSLGLTSGAWIAALLTGASVGAMAGLVIVGARGYRDGQLQTLLSVAAAGALGALLLLGFAAVLGEASFSVALLLAALTAPGTWWWLRSRRVHAQGIAGGESATRAEALPTSEQMLTVLTTRQLCEAWSMSFEALHCSSGMDKGVIVELRQRYLDELERRNPDGFLRWLATGARPASNPGGFILRASQPYPAAPLSGPAPKRRPLP